MLNSVPVQTGRIMKWCHGEKSFPLHCEGERRTYRCCSCGAGRGERESELEGVFP